MIAPLPVATAPENPVLTRIAGLVSRVIQQSDDLVIVLEYVGKNGQATRRVVSPIRLMGTDRFLALCLSREEPRQFYFSQCTSVRVDLATNYVMPVAIETGYAN